MNCGLCGGRAEQCRCFRQGTAVDSLQEEVAALKQQVEDLTVAVQALQYGLQDVKRRKT